MGILQQHPKCPLCTQQADKRSRTNSLSQRKQSTSPTDVATWRYCSASHVRTSSKNAISGETKHCQHDARANALSDADRPGQRSHLTSAVIRWRRVFNGSGGHVFSSAQVCFGRHAGLAALASSSLSVECHRDGQSPAGPGQCGHAARARVASRNSPEASAVLLTERGPSFAPGSSWVVVRQQQTESYHRYAQVTMPLALSCCPSLSCRLLQGISRLPTVGSISGGSSGQNPLLPPGRCRRGAGATP